MADYSGDFDRFVDRELSSIPVIARSATIDAMRDAYTGVVFNAEHCNIQQALHRYGWFSELSMDLRDMALTKMNHGYMTEQEFIKANRDIEQFTMEELPTLLTDLLGSNCECKTT